MLTAARINSFASLWLGCQIIICIFIVARCRLRDGKAIDLNQGRVQSRAQDRSKIVVKGANREDSGSYTCELENKIGRGTSEGVVEVDVNCE